MSIQPSERTTAVKPSVTLAINAKATQLRTQGVDIINLSVGEPDFDTPEAIKQAGIAAIQAGHTKYTAIDGLPALKEAVIQKFQRENQLSFQMDQILISCGAKHSLYNLAQAVLNPGDEVIIPAPYWVSYPPMVALANGISVIVPTTLENRFKITAEQLKKSITPKTKLVILNSPSNPTGMAYTESELVALAEVLTKHPRILITSDDIYEHILWGINRYVNILNVCPELADRTIVVNGVSKSYAMTGWRIGYAAGPKAIIAAMRKIQSHSTSNPCSIAQYAAIAALTGPSDFLHKIKKVFKERHDFVQQQLSAIKGVICPPADGAFYLFPGVQAAIARQGLTDDVSLTEKLLEEAHVAAVPGIAFGMPGFIRISYANSIENLTSALERMKPLLTS